MKRYTIDEYAMKIQENNLLISKNYAANIGKQFIDKVSYNSNDVAENTLFICKGKAFKEEYLDKAINEGSIAYISEIDYHKNIPCILVNNVQKTLSLVSNIYYDYPWKKMNLIGVTGTKGKSTTCYYIKYIIDEYLNDEGKPTSGIISSIDTYDGVINEESHITTPESLDLQQHFSNAQSSNITHMITEVSSQALKYGRLYDVCFDVGVFLNISEDHISPIEHSDLEDYFSSKLKLFKQCKIACINLESDFASRILEAGGNSEKIITFGTSENADIYGYNIRKDGNNIVFDVRTDKFDKEFILTMPGLFNVENALAAIAVAYSLNIPEKFIFSGLEKARSSGRMEKYVSKDKEKIVIVDYAHNKLSFTKLYESTKEEYKGRNIVTVFGCPGGKAFSRRKDLGLLAGLHSDSIILTSEDPGEEQVRTICEEIAEYVKRNNDNYEIVEDRGEAIKSSIFESEPNTIILLTGKGNEKRQKIGKAYIPCPSDVDYVIQYLEDYNNAIKEVAVSLE
ncbi:MAG: UDP-N-acetylmuramoyl-L-alanyl-D-glutamate--2,6-diaminopimelate ligase [Lutispora sp.]|nr:UDP-N-acetylmuramoyl-L-alanyl-D-glutamate--2,6-diaminopimelate ligase [Lutispora sp.]